MPNFVQIGNFLWTDGHETVLKRTAGRNYNCWSRPSNARWPA